MNWTESNLASEIDELFAGAEQRFDDAGTLGLLLDIARPLNPRGAAICAASHERLAVQGVTDFVSLPFPQWKTALRGFGPSAAHFAWGHLSAPPELEHSALILRPSGHSDFVVLVLEQPVPAEAASVNLISLLNQAAAAACRVVAASRSAELDRARVRQLECEHDAIHRAHAETVTAVLCEREEHAQAKRLYIDKLEQEVQRRSAALHEAVERAEAANRSKSEFLANMSHEIRTPMTAILGFAEALEDAGLSDAERTTMVQTIQRNGRHLLEIINDILDLSKIEAGRMEAEIIICEVEPLFREVVDLMRVRADARNLPLKLNRLGQIPGFIRTDPTRLRQILINLIGNAIKFTMTGEVRIELAYEPDTPGNAPGNDGYLFADIVDSGIGMTTAQLDRLFCAFSQADSSTTRRFGGTGLGLTISRRLATMLGGSIEVTSEPGRGSRFRLRVATGPLAGIQMLAVEHSPIVAAPPLQESSERNTPQPLAGKSLLLAEDGPDNQRLISFILRKAGYHVDIVETGVAAVREALAADASGRPYSCILMDMQMPEMDGYDATRTLRDRGYRHGIIALTAHAMSGDRERCLSAGCNEYATKPIDRAKLLGAIEAMAEMGPACMPEPARQTLHNSI